MGTALSMLATGGWFYLKSLRGGKVYLEAFKAPLKLEEKPCPRELGGGSWWRGSYRERTVGLRGTVLWLGEPGGRERCLFYRSSLRTNRFACRRPGGRPIPDIEEPIFKEALAKLSSNVYSVAVLPAALKVELTRVGKPDEVLLGDLPRLAGMLDRTKLSG